MADEPEGDPGLQGSKQKIVWLFAAAMALALVAVIAVMAIYSRGI